MKYYEAWAETLKEQDQAAVQTFLSNRMLERINAAALEKVDALAAQAQARWMLANGQVPRAVRYSEHPDLDLQGQVVWISVDTEKRAAVESYCLSLEDAARGAFYELGLPWWKLAWRRLLNRLHPAPAWLG